MHRPACHALGATCPGHRGRYTWHSFRIFLACSLLVSGASSAQIQALCRWQTEASAALYARLGCSDYGRLLTRAMGAVIDSSTTPNLDAFRPPISLREGLASVQHFNFSASAADIEVQASPAGAAIAANRAAEKQDARAAHRSASSHSSEGSSSHGSADSSSAPSDFHDLDRHCENTMCSLQKGHDGLCSHEMVTAKRPRREIYYGGMGS